MNKKNVINTPATHSVSSDSSSARRKTEVSAQITLSDSILTGAIVEYRKAGYNFIRHMHTNIEIYRILSGECYMDIQSETTFGGKKVLLSTLRMLYGYSIGDPSLHGR